MKIFLNILLIHQKTGELTVREVELPIDQALRNPKEPQFICEVPPDHDARVLGVNYQEAP